ncbi:MAG: hypothetical protein ACI8U3_001984 [Brevundimonas sp.]|jgi:hypothetical protein
MFGSPPSRCARTCASNTTDLGRNRSDPACLGLLRRNGPHARSEIELGHAHHGDLSPALKCEHGQLDGDADGPADHHRLVAAAGQGASQPRGIDERVPQRPGLLISEDSGAGDLLGEVGKLSGRIAGHPAFQRAPGIDLAQQAPYPVGRDAAARRQQLAQRLPHGIPSQSLNPDGPQGRQILLVEIALSLDGLGTLAPPTGAILAGLADGEIGFCQVIDRADGFRLGLRPGKLSARGRITAVVDLGLDLAGAGPGARHRERRGVAGRMFWRHVVAEADARLTSVRPAVPVSPDLGVFGHPQIESLEGCIPKLQAAAFDGLGRRDSPVGELQGRHSDLR